MSSPTEPRAACENHAAIWRCTRSTQRRVPGFLSLGGSTTRRRPPPSSCTPGGKAAMSLALRRFSARTLCMSLSAAAEREITRANLSEDKPAKPLVLEDYVPNA